MKLALAILLATARIASAQQYELAMGPLEKEAPFIDVLTFGEGGVIFEKFGHAAICLRYHEARNQTVCFNYGVTTFDDPGALMWGFVRGKQEFWVEPTPFGVMFSVYQYEDRDVWRQTLPVTDEQAREIETALWKALDLRYIYDHLYDNCSTRIRDVIDANTGGKLHNDEPYPLTFRQFAIRGFAEMPGLVAGMDWLLGRGMDVHPTTWEAMFHPDVLRAEIEKKFGAKPEIVYRRHGAPYSTEGGGSLRLVPLVLALLLALPILLTRARLAWLIVGILMSLIGVVLWALAIISPVGVVRWNELLLVFLPSDFLIIRRRYALYRVGLLVLVSLLRAIGVFHQPLWVPLLTALAPMALAWWRAGDK